MNSPIRQFRQAVITALRDEEYGLNARYAAIAEEHGLPGVKIDFGPSTLNFVEAQPSPDLLEALSLEFPFVCVYGQSAANRNAEKFRLFAGDVTVIVQIVHSWAMVDDRHADQTLDAMEAAALEAINAAIIYRRWPSCVSHNGQVSIARSAPQGKAGRGMLAISTLSLNALVSLAQPNT